MSTPNFDQNKDKSLSSNISCLNRFPTFQSQATIEGNTHRRMLKEKKGEISIRAMNINQSKLINTTIDTENPYLMGPKASDVSKGQLEFNFGDQESLSNIEEESFFEEENEHLPTEEKGIMQEYETELKNDKSLKGNLDMRKRLRRKTPNFFCQSANGNRGPQPMKSIVNMTFTKYL